MPSCLQHWLLFSSRPGLSVVPANNSKIPTNMQPKTTDRSAAVQHRLLTGVLVAAAVTLSGCSSSDNASQTPPLPDYQPDPVSVNEAASKVDPAELRLPLQVVDDTIVEPGWQTPPHSVDNMFLSAGGDDSVLTFRRSEEHTSDLQSSYPTRRSSVLDNASQTPPLRDYQPDPVSVNEAASKVDPAELRLPLQLEDDTIVDPGWQTPPHSVDNMFLSAGGDDSVLTFRAVDDTGTIRWEAQRPISCSGFTLTSDDEQRYAVLADIDSEAQDLGDTVVNAYELDTGESHWGPVPVPGPHTGPGTVFAAPPDQGMGDSGAKVLLDPATGDVLVDEAEQSEIIVLGEFHGTVLLVQDDQV